LSWVLVVKKLYLVVSELEICLLAQYCHIDENRVPKNAGSRVLVLDLTLRVSWCDNCSLVLKASSFCAHIAFRVFALELSIFLAEKRLDLT